MLIYIVYIVCNLCFISSYVFFFHIFSSYSRPLSIYSNNGNGEFGHYLFDLTSDKKESINLLQHTGGIRETHI